MARIQYVDPSTATGKQKDLLDAVQRRFGSTPNMTKAMAGSAVLEGYLGLVGALAAGRLSPAIGERVALAVSQTNECSYCLSAHSFLAEKVLRLDGDDIHAARRFEATDPKAAAALRFTEALVAARGGVSAADIGAARSAGLSDAELQEIVGHVAVNVLTNYFARAFDIDNEWPVVTPYPDAAAA